VINVKTDVGFIKDLMGCGSHLVALVLGKGGYRT